MSKKKSMFGKLFGKKNPDVEGESYPENIADYPDEIQEVREVQAQKERPESEDVSADAAVSVDEEEISISEMEKEVKEYFNATHGDSVEDRIKDIRANALNTYAKDEEMVEAPISTMDNEAVSLDDNDTKIYDASEKVSEQAAKDKSTKSNMSELIKLLKNDGNASENADNAVPDDNTDDDDVDEVLEDKEEKLAEIFDEENEYPHNFEYVDSYQDAEFHKSFKRSAILSLCSFALTAVFTVLCIWFECGNGAGLPFSYMMKPGYFGRVYAMVSLQMLAFCVMLNLDGFARGIKKLSLKKAAPESVAVVAAVLCTVHTIISAVAAYNSTEYRTFCFAGCIVALFLSFNTFVKDYTRFKAFVLVATQKPKLSSVKLDALSDENSIFDKYLDEDSDVLCVTKTENVADFAKNSYAVPKAMSHCNFVTYIVLALGVVTAIVKYFLLDSTGYAAITGGMSVIMFAAPVTYLLSVSLPYFITSMRVSKLHNTVIGEAACDTIENAGVISFDDTAVFPPKSVKVTSIKTYNETPIDKVIVCMAKIFNKLGGPLSYVFASSVAEDLSHGSEVMVLESSKDGVHLTIDNEDVLIGNSNYLRLFDVEAPVDDSDEAEARALTSILYLVTGGKLAAKFYVRYTINRNFEGILRGLYDAGVCCGVRTIDPGIDTRIVEASLKDGGYPISVINKNVKDIDKIEESSSGAIVGLSGIHGFLRSFILVDKLRSIYRTNYVFATLGSIIGLAASMVLVFTGSGIGYTAMILFYLLWMVPQLLVSLFKK